MFRRLQVFVSGVALAGFTLAGAAVVSGQEPAKPVLTLEGDSAVIILLIKPEKATDFETVIARYKDAFAKSDSAKRKEQLAGLKIFKSPAAMGGNTAFIFSVDPIVKGEEYDITRIIHEVFPSESTAMFNIYKEGFAGRQIIPLNRLP